MIGWRAAACGVRFPVTLFFAMVATTLQWPPGSEPMTIVRIVATTLMVMVLAASPLGADADTGAVDQAVQAYRNGDYAAALDGFKPAAEAGNPAAQYWLGQMYAEGIGVDKDMTKAAEWTEKSAKQGEIAAMRALGGLYLRGEGVLQDYEQGHQWLEKAAYSNDAVAQRELGQTYEKGEGVEQSKVWAYVWYNYAAKNGDQQAEKLRDSVARSMSEAEVSQAQELGRSIEGEFFAPMPGGKG